MNYDFEKLIQTINFLCINLLENNINEQDIFCLIFLADRYHLLKYGRMVTSIPYYVCKDQMYYPDIQSLYMWDDGVFNYVNQYLEFNDTNIISKKQYDLNVFSETDIESLNQAVSVYKNLKETNIDVYQYVNRFFKYSNDQQYINHSFKGFENQPIERIDIIRFFDVIENDWCQQINETHRNLSKVLLDF